MFLLAIDDLVLADLAIEAEFDTLLTDESESREWSTRTREGLSGSVFFGNVAEPAIWSWVLICPDVATMDSVLAVLTSDVSEERRLLAQRIDVADTRVIARAAMYAIRQIGELTLVVEFEGRDSIWTSESAIETEHTFTSVEDQAMPLVVPGNTTAAPRLVFIPVAQRTTQTAAVGYKWRRRFTVVNNSEVPWYRMPCRVDLGDTTAHVTAVRALASGFDVRLLADGIEQQRTLVTWNSAASYLWFNIENLQPGDSQTYDIISGNPAATDPALLAMPSALTYPNLPPFTLASSSNAALVYPMTVDGLGAWRLSKTTAPSAPDFTVPGSWRRVLTLDNMDNPDQTYSAVYHPPDALAGAGIRAKMRAERHPAKFDVQRANEFDGVAVSHPLGITSITANFQWTNPNGLAALVILARESDADPWATKYTYNGVAASATPIAPGAQTFSPAVQHVACAVWPIGGWEMPPASAVAGGTAWWDTTLSLGIDTTKLGITIESAWTEIYEWATTARIGGGGNAVPPYRELLVGNSDGADGSGTPRAVATLAQALVIDCEEYTQEVWTVVAGEEVTYVEDLSAHVVTAIEGWDE